MHRVLHGELFLFGLHNLPSPLFGLSIFISSFGHVPDASNPRPSMLSFKFIHYSSHTPIHSSVIGISICFTSLSLASRSKLAFAHHTSHYSHDFLLTITITHTRFPQISISLYTFTSHIFGSHLPDIFGLQFHHSIPFSLLRFDRRSNSSNLLQLEFTLSLSTVT